MIRQYVLLHDEYVLNTIDKGYDELSPFFDKYFKSVDVSTRKLYKDAVLVKQAIDSKEY